jgi:tetratricopeptide (TPR) repeat protein
MRRWRVVGALLATVWFGCAVSPYRQAELHIARKEYRPAIQIYLKALNPHQQNGKTIIAYEPEAMTGIGVVLWHMKRYNTAVRVLSQVARKTPQYGKALFYLGICQEALSKPDKAHDVYRRYAVLDDNDPYREVLRWRSEWVSKQTAAADMRRDPSSIQVSSLPKNSVAVLYFQNMANDKWSPLQKGFAQLLIDDLSNVDQIRVVDREKLQQLIDAKKWTPKILMQDARHEEIAKLLGARAFVKGAFRVGKQQAIEFNVGTIRIDSSDPVQYRKFQGSIPEILSIEKRILMRILADLGVTLTPDQERLVSGTATKNFDAFSQFCTGLDDMDAGRFQSAQTRFARALELDSDFFLAQDRIVNPNIYAATHVPGFLDMGGRVESYMAMQGGQAGAPVQGTGAFAVTTTNRLQDFGYWMDAGFIPGTDSRSQGDVPFEGATPTGPNPLSGAPAPPWTPSRWMLPGPPNPPSRQ